MENHSTTNPATQCSRMIHVVHVHVLSPMLMTMMTVRTWACVPLVADNVASFDWYFFILQAQTGNGSADPHQEEKFYIKGIARPLRFNLTTDSLLVYFWNDFAMNCGISKLMTK